MQGMRKNAKWKMVLPAALILVLMFAFAAFGAEEAAAEYVPAAYGTMWALLPPVVAIGLALITKEVYSSLFVGILVGSVLYSGMNFEVAVTHMFENGVIGVLSDSYNVGILVFLVILGAMVGLMNRAGGSAAFGQFAAKRIKSRTGAQLSTILLGVMIFIDDYFNCLTVGSVMRPVTDKFKVSRAKLAYLIDATAAPVCIIAPISSWAAAVTGFVEGEDGFSMFIRAIPYNYYAILTIVMMVAMVLLKEEFGPMAKHEKNAVKGDLYTTDGRPYKDSNDMIVAAKGTVLDLLIPIAALIVCCVIGMLYTGGFFSGTDFVTAFSQSDASLGLTLGSFFALVITIILYQVRHVMTFNDCMGCIPDGFKAMVPAIMILTFAWTLCSFTRFGMYSAVFVKNAMAGAGDLKVFLPAVIFLIGCAIGFATGTSWGTIGIMAPIVVSVFNYDVEPVLCTIGLAAACSGGVMGDHCSPISDTTIMASAGAHCFHLNHVFTQLPYALTASGVAFVSFIIAGLVQSVWLCLAIAVALMIGTLLVIRAIVSRRHAGIFQEMAQASQQLLHR